MNTIKEEPEKEGGEERFVRGEELRESLSTVKPKDRVRSVGSGWVEYATPSGRLYYWNSETKENSWKPPRKMMVHAKSCSLPQNASFSRLSLNPEEGTKTGNIGKILRTGVLKIAEIDGKVKKKWVKAYVVLTEYYILFTTIVGTFEKLIKKTKKPSSFRLHLLHAEVKKGFSASTRANIYRLKTPSRDVLFRCKNPTVAESWFQALALVINNSIDLDDSTNFDLKERERTNSFDLGVTLRTKEAQHLSVHKSVSLSDFSVEESMTGGPRTCLSDFFGVKYPTPPGWITIYDPNIEQFCYVNCITQKKWFWTMTDDGHPYFYEEGSGRRSWLLPSIYLDVNVKTLEEMKKSIGSRKSVVTDV